MLNRTLIALSAATVALAHKHHHYDQDHRRDAEKSSENASLNLWDQYWAEQDGLDMNSFVKCQACTAGMKFVDNMLEK